ncbi:Methyl-accepting chemotaxis protein McpH [Andreprevotia sp. IGB-42]|uniref:methyl-accepting chemotaxis protein n=1 Tax=Andreprevotia sp. IGB-42 TaxID=2497473 RepID=UPI00157F1135|nr:methyl-accepting chemotaxis protein [Andreprevotia sp. IGB-42]KAF0811543.1 Methyl-accepting chemotaxis protein McpH [Andreprevotia sp. IGB-42]
MRSLSIAQKLYGAFGLLILVVVLMVGSTLFNFHRVADRSGWTVHTYQVLLQKDQLLEALVNIETGQRGFLITGKDEFLEPYNGGQAQFAKALAQIRQLTSDNAAQQQRLQQLEGQQQALLSQVLQPQIELRRAIARNEKSPDELMQAMGNGAGKQRMDELRSVLAQIGDAESSLLDARAEEVAQIRAFSFACLIIAGLIVVAIALGMILTLPRSVGKRLGYAVGLTESAAAGDFSRQIEVEGSDEISQLLQAFAAMQQRLRQLLQQVRQSSDALLGGAADISSSAEQVAQQARDQSNAAAAMAAAVEQLTVSINHVAASAADAHSESREAGRVSSAGAEVIDLTVHGIREIAATVRSASGSVTQLGEQAQQIFSIVKVIREIADQTNLLALNAAIEAARAGEQGRGFAVVADEVRKLAERTGSSTQEIANMIQRIQSGTQQAVSNMGSGVEQVETGVELANQAGTAIGQIRSNAARVSSVVSDISEALNEQRTVSHDVASNVERIAQMSEETSRAVEASAQTAQRLRDLAQQLGQAVGQFRLA